MKLNEYSQNLLVKLVPGDIYLKGVNYFVYVGKINTFMPLDFSFEKLEKKQYNLHLKINKSHLDNINDLFFKSRSNLLSRVKFYSINKFSKLTFSQYIKNIEIDKDKIVSNLKIISKEKIINMCEKKHYQNNFIDTGLKLINVDREIAVNFKDFKMLI